MEEGHVFAMAYYNMATSALPSPSDAIVLGSLGRRRCAPVPGYWAQARFFPEATTHVVYQHRQ